MTLASFQQLIDICRVSPPVAALVLGSGMGEVVDRWGRVAAVLFSDIPGLTRSSVHGHRGQLSLIRLNERPVLVLEGRLHFYEGHPWERVTRPTRIVADLGAPIILHTNAAGGIAPELEPGSLLAIADHVELSHPFWWRHPGVAGLGETRPSPYSARLLGLLGESARGMDFELHCGIYASLTGPCYETAAEIRALKSWDVDAVGMSTAREVLEGVKLGMECAAVSCITNRAAGLSDTPLSHEEVLRIASAQSGRLAALIERFLNRLC
jgi:purine-nucleoside phosphorylase